MAGYRGDRGAAAHQPRGLRGSAAAMSMTGALARRRNVNIPCFRITWRMENLCLTTFRYDSQFVTQVCARRDSGIPHRMPVAYLYCAFETSCTITPAPVWRMTTHNRPFSGDHYLASSSLPGSAACIFKEELFEVMTRKRSWVNRSSSKDCHELACMPGGGWL